MKMGRPKKEIDQKIFESLCGIQCTRAEMLEFFHLTDKTLDRWCKETYNGSTFSAIFSRKRGAGKISLRRNMFQLSASNASMAIFMAKNWLGMRDQPEPDDPGGVAQPVAIVFEKQDANKNNNE